MLIVSGWYSVIATDDPIRKMSILIQGFASERQYAQVRFIIRLIYWNYWIDHLRLDLVSPTYAPLIHCVGIRDAKLSCRPGGVGEYQRSALLYTSNERSGLYLYDLITYSESSYIETNLGEFIDVEGSIGRGIGSMYRLYTTQPRLLPTFLL